MGDFSGRIEKDAIDGICGKYETGDFNKNDMTIDFCKKHYMTLKKYLQKQKT